jgi:hypothetical protein
MSPAFIISRLKWNGDTHRQSIVGVAHDRALAEILVSQLESVEGEGWPPEYHITETIFLTERELSE